MTVMNSTLGKASIESLAAEDLVHELIDKVAHYLPEQAPIHAFVHHNPLHTFEHLSFKDAVREAGNRFQAHSFMSEMYYRTAVNNGRILPDDISAVLEAEIENLDAVIFPGGPTRRDYLVWRLTTLFDVPSSSSVRWWLHEHSSLDKPHALYASAATLASSTIYCKASKIPEKGSLKQLWLYLAEVVKPEHKTVTYPRARDFYLARTGIDTDSWVHPLLVKLASAFVDQGVSNHALPLRGQGFLAAFQAYMLTPVLQESWLKSVKQQCKKQIDNNWSSAQTVIHLLETMSVPKEHWEQTIFETLHSLRGWAGMFRQFECHPDKLPINPVPGKLIDFLAVQLTLDLAAAYKAERESTVAMTDYQATWTTPETVTDSKISLVYEAFVSAQAFTFLPALFADKTKASAWLAEHERFNHFERSYLLHLAFERHHRNHILNALTEHQKPLMATDVCADKSCDHSSKAVPKVQAVFCMDDREESTRRHLEEILPEAETYGCPGFFGVVMQYKGFDDVHSRPLCPVTATPQHFVEEIAIDNEKNYRSKRLRQGQWLKFLQRSRLKLLSSSIWTVAMGGLHVASLLSHTLFPSFSHNLLHRITGHHHDRPKTTLKLFREDDKGNINDQRNAAGLLPGFTLQEATDIVEKLLRTMGLTKHFAPLITIIGHGSSSMNNPHEAAYDCGATGGGRGGPNARAFAMMANHPTVRANLKQRGLDIPDTTHVVGGYHNTADDTLTFYELETVATHLRDQLESMEDALLDACAHSAHERCRRFNDAPANITVQQALKVVQRHSTDLAQPRPEYGHSTNAVCIIGRREKTRNLYMDRRAFLISYDPEQDSDGTIVANILQAAGPVGAGINLEYYFSVTDPVVYGCGTKLPHNIAGLVGVMNGHSSDLRTGLTWQMVEIHEPVRLLTIVEATPERLLEIADKYPMIGRLVGNGWIQLISWHPQTGELFHFYKGKFVPHTVTATGFPVIDRSESFFRGVSDHLGCAHIVSQNPKGI